jgi:hypothetical protein
MSIDKQIVTLTQQLLATHDPEQSEEISTKLMNAISERLDRIRSYSGRHMPKGPATGSKASE